MRIAAAAKVNLHLAVLDRRADGFHDIVSVLQAVDLADALQLERTRRDGPVVLHGMPEVAADANLVTRAIERFRARADLAEGVVARLEKRVPAGAGLGGGSSDAAAALRGMQALFGSPLSGAELASCARELGSDVPFFLAGPAALAEGRGERLHALVPRTDYALLAVTPSVRVATIDAFAWLDTDRAAGLDTARAAVTGAVLPPGAAARAYRDRAPGDWPFGNSFDGPVLRRLPALALVADRMRDAGAPAPRLTGSGSTLIAVFEDAAEAAACARRLAAEPPPGCASSDVRILAPLASIPGVQYYS